jgi:threonine dehydrogenase-like Zn-dependent dehydrogenase
VEAVEFRATIPGYLFARSVGRLRQSAPFGRFGTVSLGDRPEPGLPGPDWVLLDVQGCGLCGTDVSVAAYTFSLTLEPFSSFPAVLGHEILARVAEAGSAAGGLEVGQRVAVDPMIGCAVRGHPEPCRACAAGQPPLCARSGDSGSIEIDGRPMRPGTALGFHADLPGGFTSRIVAHRSQVHPVPDGIPDDVAVLTEPLSIGVHGVVRTAPHAGPVLVIGSGPIALATVWALRCSGYDGEIVCQTKRPTEAALARRLGATTTVTPGDHARRALEATGARSYDPMLGPEVFAGGGFPCVFDGVGTRSSLHQALRSCAAGGRVIVLGCAGVVPDLDLTLLWARQLTVQGYYGYGLETWEGTSLHTYEITYRWMQGSPAGLGDFVTHRFPIRDYRHALRAATSRASSGAVKVILQPGRPGRQPRSR